MSISGTPDAASRLGSVVDSLTQNQPLPAQPALANRLESVADSLSQGHLHQGPQPVAPTLPSAEDWRIRGHDAVMRIPISVQIVLGAVRMPVSKLMDLSRGAVIPLDRKVGDLVDIVVNERTIARGEVVVVDEAADRFAVAVREVVRAGEE